MFYKRGFTLLELLIVIAIIGILATVVIVATSESRDKAQYAKVAQQVQEIEKALWLYAEDHKNAPSWNGSWTYWTCGVCSTGGNLQIQKIVAGSNAEALARFPGFSQYLSAAPTSPFKAGFYAYHSKDNPVPASGCYTNQTTINTHGPGVSIRIGPGGARPDALFNALDQMIDGGDGPWCGKMMYEDPAYGGNWNIYYVISPNIAL